MDRQRSGRLSVVSDELVAGIDAHLRLDRCFTISAMMIEFPTISPGTLHSIIYKSSTVLKALCKIGPKLFD